MLPDTTDLACRSIEIILGNQSPSGGYIASPNFPAYRFCWFRDGSFSAYAMDLVGEHGSAARFHDWAAAAINRRADLIQSAVRKAQAGKRLTNADVLHARYTSEGEEDLFIEVLGDVKVEWTNFQLDGLGTWLWALGEHVSLSGTPLRETWAQAAGFVASYLSALWKHPCYDCWEEFSDRVHLHTLATIYGGLQAHNRLSGRDHSLDLQAIATLIHKEGVTGGRFVKFFGSNGVDTSLLGLATPYRVVQPDHPVMLETVAQIEADLVRGGGVHRYTSDTYYGGGEWLLLAGWLGWYYTETGRLDRAKALLSWMEAQADAQGNLPEQVPATLNDRNYMEPWVQRWGPVANPLLWSHAKYLILYEKLRAFV